MVLFVCSLLSLEKNSALARRKLLNIGGANDFWSRSIGGAKPTFFLISRNIRGAIAPPAPQVPTPPAQQHALANQTLIARWMKAVIIIERKEIAPIMTVI